MGQISENELLQLKLAALKARATLTDNESNLNAKMFQLRAFLGLDEQERIEPVVPESVPELVPEPHSLFPTAFLSKQPIRHKKASGFLHFAAFPI